MKPTHTPTSTGKSKALQLKANNLKRLINKTYSPSINMSQIISFINLNFRYQRLTLNNITNWSALIIANIWMATGHIWFGLIWIIIAFIFFLSTLKELR